MATTPRLGLYLPVGTDMADVAVAINPQMDAIDSAMDCQVCTSITRPAAPYTGKLIWETDTKTVSEWTGAAWVSVLSNKWAQGKIDYQSFAGPSAPAVGNNSEGGPYLKSTWQQIAGRKYRVMWTLNLGINLVGSPVPETDGIQIRLRYANTNGIVVNTDSLIYWQNADYINASGNLGSAPNGTIHQGFFEFTASASVQITVGLFISKAPNSVNGNTVFLSANNHHNLMVEDVGVT